VASYTIGDVAERAGFTASALRFYEGIGLVVPVRPGHVVSEENGRWFGN
jgi:DNA-binding transcriptional MerR regulator